MNPFKRLIISIFGLVLAIFIYIETQILYAGECIPVVAIRTLGGAEYALILNDGA